MVDWALEAVVMEAGAGLEVVLEVVKVEEMEVGKVEQVEMKVSEVKWVGQVGQVKLMVGERAVERAVEEESEEVVMAAEEMAGEAVVVAALMEGARLAEGRDLEGLVRVAEGETALAGWGTEGGAERALATAVVAMAREDRAVGVVRTLAMHELHRQQGSVDS